MRPVLVAMVSVAVAVSPAAAETFGGWQYKTPKGFTLETVGDHLAFTKVTAPTFCSLALFATRATEEVVVKEQAREWQRVVADNFTTTGVRRAATSKTKRAFGVQPTLASIKDADGNEFAAQHYAVTLPGMIASVLLTSSTPASLAKCKPVAKAFLDSLAIDAPSTVSDDPEARVETPVGRWAVGASDLAADAVVREYTFAADGTYRFRSQTTGGKLKPEQWRVVDETGKYTVVGNQLTLAPATAASTLHDETGARPASKVPLEKTTYTWSKRYFPATNAWTLRLVPAKKTARDGELPADERYTYSDGVQPAWKQDAPPPAEPAADAPSDGE
ncbi:MAG TPA: hypothetical protein VM513_09265 [Kofleriaceae bacterium]|nr:hypothetical protein [Kofleriaceae bacterium]